MTEESVQFASYLYRQIKLPFGRSKWSREWIVYRKGLDGSVLYSCSRDDFVEQFQTSSITLVHPYPSPVKRWTERLKFVVHFLSSESVENTFCFQALNLFTLAQWCRQLGADDRNTGLDCTVTISVFSDSVSKGEKLRQFYANRCALQSKSEMNYLLLGQHFDAEWTPPIRLPWVRRDRDDSFLAPLVSEEQPSAVLPTHGTNCQQTKQEEEIEVRASGQPGLNGLDGASGDSGARGLKGADITDHYPRGEDGRTGSPGAPGHNGQPGSRGQDGSQVLVELYPTGSHTDEPEDDKLTDSMQVVNVFVNGNLHGSLHLGKRDTATTARKTTVQIVKINATGGAGGCGGHGGLGGRGGTGGAGGGRDAVSASSGMYGRQWGPQAHQEQSTVQFAAEAAVSLLHTGLHQLYDWTGTGSLQQMDRSYHSVTGHQDRGLFLDSEHTNEDDGILQYALRSIALEDLGGHGGGASLNHPYMTRFVQAGDGGAGGPGGQGGSGGDGGDGGTGGSVLIVTSDSRLFQLVEKFGHIISKYGFSPRCSLCSGERSYPPLQSKQSPHTNESRKPSSGSNDYSQQQNYLGSDECFDLTLSYYELDKCTQTGAYQSDPNTGNSWKVRPRMLPGHWGHSGGNGQSGLCGQPGQPGQNGSVKYMIIPKSFGEERRRRLMYSSTNLERNKSQGLPPDQDPNTWADSELYEKGLVYEERFKVSIIDYDVQLPEAVEFIEPGSSFTIRNIQLRNSSSMALPSGAQLEFFGDPMILLQENSVIKLPASHLEKELIVNYPVRITNLRAPATISPMEVITVSIECENLLLSKKRDRSDPVYSRPLFIDCFVRLDRRLRVVGPQTSVMKNKADPFPTASEAGWFRWIVPQCTEVNAVHGTIGFSVTDSEPTTEHEDKATRTCFVWIQSENNTELFDRLPIQFELVYRDQLIEYQQLTIRSVTQDKSSQPSVTKSWADTVTNVECLRWSGITSNPTTEMCAWQKAVLITDAQMTHEEYLVWHSLLSAVGLSRHQIWDVDCQESIWSGDPNGWLFVCPRVSSAVESSWFQSGQLGSTSSQTNEVQSGPVAAQSASTLDKQYSNLKDPVHSPNNALRDISCDPDSSMLVIRRTTTDEVNVWNTSELEYPLDVVSSAPENVCTPRHTTSSHSVYFSNRSSQALSVKLQCIDERLVHESTKPVGLFSSDHTWILNGLGKYGLPEYGFPNLISLSNPMLKKSCCQIPKIDSSVNSLIPQIVSVVSPWGQLFLALLAVLPMKHRANLIRDNPSTPHTVLPWGEHLSVAYLAALSLEAYLVDAVERPNQTKLPCLVRYERACADLREFPRAYQDQLSTCLTALLRQKQTARIHGSAHMKRQISTQYHLMVQQLKLALGKKEYNFAIQEARDRLRNPERHLGFWHLLYSSSYT
ncbi:hypothetical protein FGIG_05592 [Fasciola gigantica]|uniref:Uncharacterized protein n=1 Tax=Fasciola gigantica TaxID=46835 RepID=A0A504YIM2_FASGI|nr:hypothetical protein FGIG_05592 [Fasciola gigantica]